MRSDANQAESAINRVTARHAQMRQNLAMGAGIVGAAGLAFAKAGIDMAAQYQMKLLELQNSAGVTADHMDRLKASILAANMATGQNLGQTTAEYTAAIQHGLTPEQMLSKDPKSGLDLGMILAQYAHVQQLYHHIDPSTSVESTVMFAHQQGVYDPAGVAQITESLNKLAMTSGATQAQVLTQGGYFIQLARRMGMTVDQSMQVLQQLSISGLLRGKGGAGVADLVLGLTTAPAGNEFLESKKAPALTELGLYDKHGRSTVMHHGQIDFDKLMQILDFDSTHMDTSKYVADLKALGGIPGMRAALQMTNPASMIQEKKLRAQESKIPSIEAQVKSTYATWNGAMQLLTSNLQTFMTNAWMPFIDHFSPGLLWLSKVVAEATTIMNKFPTATLVTTTTLLGLSVAAVAVGTASAIKNFFSLGASLEVLAAEATAARDTSLLGGIPIPGLRGRAAIEAEEGAAAVAKRGILSKVLGGLGFALLAPWKSAGKVLQTPVNAVRNAGSRFIEGQRNLGADLSGNVEKRGVTTAVRASAGRDASFMAGFWRDLRLGFGGIARPVEMLMFHFGGLGRMLLGFGAIFGRIGVNFIPFVGIAIDVITVVQLITGALGYFKEHPKDVGTWVGNIIGYLRYRLIPQTIKTVESWGPAIGAAFQSLWQ